MRLSRLALAVFLLSCLSARGVLARDCSLDLGPRFSCCDKPMHWAARHPSGERQFAIVTEDGKVTLLLTSDVLALQLSDRTLHEVDRKLRREEREPEDVAFADAIKSAVLTAVRHLLDHSAECPVRAIESAEYRDGRLVFTTAQGDHVLDGVDVGDRDVLEQFSERDARAFVREFELLKGHRR